MERSLFSKRYLYFIAGILVFLGLYLASLYSYLLFHSLAEIFSIVVACGIFMVTWNSRRFLDNHYFLFIGIAYLFIGGLDLTHTLAYKGMGVLEGYETNLPTQLWIAARYMESLSLFLAPFFLGRRLKVNSVFLGYALATFLLLLSIFYWNIFPVCFIEGVGLTPFKKVSEYIISLILLASIALLLKNRREFDREVLQWVAWSIIVSIASELAFTFYIDAYGFSNLMGHFFKILSFYFIYRAIIVTGLTKPYDLLFRNLKQSEVLLREEKNKIQNYLDIVGVILLVINADQKVRLINKKGCEILGYNGNEMIGKNWFDTFIPEKNRDEVKAEFRKLVGGEIDAIEYFENPILTRSGEERIIGWHHVILRDEKGDITSRLSSGEDITERKQMEKELARLASFPQLNPNPVIEVDLTGQIHYLNPAAEQLFPDLKKAGIEHPWLADLEKIADTLEHEQKRTHTRELRAGDIWYQQTIHSVMEGTRLRIYGFNTTERRRMAEELRKSHDDLELRVQERTAELAKANEKLAEQSRILEAFFTSTITPLVLFDRNFNFIRVNEAYAKACQRDVSEFPGHNHFEFYPSDAKAKFEQVVETKEPYVAVAKPFAFPDHPEWGTSYWDWILTPLLDQKGEVEYLVFSLEDVTERVRAEKSRGRLAHIVETTSDLIGIANSDGQLFYLNRAGRKMLGLGEEEDISGMRIADAHPDWAGAMVVNEGIPSAMQTGLWSGETAFLSRDGTEIPASQVILTHKGPDGEVEFLSTIARDVTGRKRAEEALKAERQRFNDVLEMLPAYLVLLTPDYHVPFANRFFRERFGESHGKRCFEYLFGRSEACETCETYTVLKTNLPHHWEWTGPDGRIYDVFDFPFTDADGSVLILEMGIDITERKRAEEALRAAQLYNRSLIEASLDPLVTISADGKIMDVNTATELATGVLRHQLIGSDFSDYFTHREKAKEGYQQAFSQGSVRDYPLAIRDTSGSIIDVLYNATVYRDEAGEIEGVFAAARDVTERKRAEEALSAAHQYTRSLIEASLDPLITISPDGKIMDVNKATESATGLLREQLIGTDFSNYFTEPDRAREGYRQVFLQGFVKDYPLTIQHVSGKVTDVLYHATVYKNEAGEIQGVFAAARDITVRKELQRRIEATNALLNLFVRMPSRREYLDAAIELIQNWSSCRYAGIRVVNEKDYIPYESYRGFSRQFWESENMLSVRHDQCACIRVVTGNPESQDHSRMTHGGSFWCNDTFEFFGHLSEEEKARFRGVCVRNGFRSVAIIPIRYREKILGAIHLADEREEIISLASIEFIESMAPLIGEAINRFNLEEEIQESETRLRTLSSQLLTAHESERKRIAMELHDGIGQILTAIKFKVENILQEKGKVKAKAKEKSLEAIVPMVRESVEEVRRIQMDLRPSTLDDLGILATLGWFCREYQKVYSHIRIEKEIGLQENEVSTPLKTVIYRLTQEALNNIAKHSKADLIHLSLRKREDRVEWVVKDNGIGFDLEEILSSERSRRGLGLNSMRERVELSGGTFEIETAPGAGTMVRANWPI